MGTRNTGLPIYKRRCQRDADIRTRPKQGQPRDSSGSGKDGFQGIFGTRAWGYAANLSPRRSTSKLLWFPRFLKRNAVDDVLRFSAKSGGHGDQLQILDELTDGLLLADDRIQGHRTEHARSSAADSPARAWKSNVLTKYLLAQSPSSFQKIRIHDFGCIVILSGHDIHTATAELIGDRRRHMDVHVKLHGHLEQSLAAHSQKERGVACRFATVSSWRSSARISSSISP